MKRKYLISLGIILGGGMLTSNLINSSSAPQALGSGDQLASREPAAHHRSDGGFQNTATNLTENSGMGAILMRYLIETRIDASPSKAIPLMPLTRDGIAALPDSQDSVIRLGHSSILLKIAGQTWLIDPVFSDRASPFSFIGPKRFHQPPIALEQLPEIDGVLISHDHYDHLDEESIKRLHHKVKRFIVPLGVEQHLLRWGVDKDKVQPLDWWQSVTLGELSITATPTQHFSGRGLWDKNQTLWASYVIQSDRSKLYFSGDSGYFDGFKAIGERFGPFDLTMIETGAYDKDWPSIHMTPEQSLQAHLDLGGRQMMPIHNGTFDLAFHSWYEPLERIAALAADANTQLITPIVGQVLDIHNTPESVAWWREEQLNLALNE
ncbi:MBL fold metallo-hydrolase [Shewanella sp. Isolate8]|uniref:MBL fold metallo-hydrolase n=1 Tax=Shewanella sp. Isolate8 TaxID=2908529 RepID=UPI001EFE72F0|nr:MBL fold metallo-hydrolase [Shewanella sp. Isolate8]MCG9748085.1 MBL fold metallo-hydrolase [Shewanella sp. Isolate8]